MPLGLPVVPEVYSRNSGCSASNASAWCSGDAGVDDVVPPHVAALGPRRCRRRCAGPPGRVRSVSASATASSAASFSGAGLPRRNCPSAVISSLALASAIRAPQRGGGEAGEDHAVHHAEPCAGQHRDDGLRDHRQVDRDAVAGDQPQIRQRVGGFAHLGLQIAVGQGAVFADPLTLPVDGDPIAVAGFDVAVHAVVGDVEFAASEPFGKRRVPTSPAPRKTVSPKTVGWPARPRTPAGLARPLGTVVAGVGLRGELWRAADRTWSRGRASRSPARA